MEIRRIEAKAVTDTVKELFLRCNYEIGQDILDALAQAREREPSALGREVLGQLLENDRIAAQEQLPICQDTGMAFLFVEYRVWSQLAEPFIIRLPLMVILPLETTFPSLSTMKLSLTFSAPRNL